jgi:pimeloyl-ACP methyl ester carboxylesterase
MSDRFVMTVDGCDLAGERWAGGDELVVLLHEGVADRRGWHEVAALLAPRVTVVAYDRRGFGESPVSPGKFAHTGDLGNVLAREGAEKAWLVGASAGGGLALDFTLLEPGRVAGLVLIGTAVSGAPLFPEDEVLQRLDQRYEEATAAGDLDALNRLDAWVWLDGPYSPEGRVGGAARELALDMNAIILRNDDAEDAGDSGVRAWDRLGEVAVPVTVACGSLDMGPIIERSKKLAALLPGGRYVELAGFAHQPYLEDPEAVAALIRDAIG